MRPEGLTARREARIDLCSGLRILQTVIDAPRGLGLRPREARCRCLVRHAHQRRRIEPASPRIFEHAVGDAVERVTRGERPAMEHAQCGHRQQTCRICEDGERRVEVARHQSREVVRRHAGDDAVVVGWEPLRRHQTLRTRPTSIR